MPEMSQEESKGDYQYLQRTDSHHSGRKSVTIYMKTSRRKNGVVSNGKMQVKTIWNILKHIFTKGASLQKDKWNQA